MNMIFRSTIPKLCVIVVAAFLLSSIACGGPGSTEQPQTEPAQAEVGPRPNVVIILIDALRADRIGANGYPLPTTPSIDRLAAEGINFTQALSQATWTKPSIATLFTGRLPMQHGVQRVQLEDSDTPATDTLAPSLTTLAERLQAAGYTTSAIINQVHIRREYGFAQGFDHFRATRGKSAFKLNRMLAEWLDGRTEAQKASPTFLYLHYLDPHWPYDRRLKDDVRFGEVTMVHEPPRRGNVALDWFHNLPPEAIDESLRALSARYDREIAFSDAAVGEVVEMLRENGLYDDSILIVTSDHGESFGEHRALQHGYGPYEELIHIPLVMRLPDVERWQGTTIDAPVGLIDVGQTILDQLDLLDRLDQLDRPFDEGQGASLLSAETHRTAAERPFFAEGLHSIGVRRGRYKLIRRDDGGRQFYDLEADPGETTPRTCDVICEELATWLDWYVASADGQPIDRQVAPLTDEQIDQLKSLGYL